jgi:hypothetical protein
VFTLPDWRDLLDPLDGVASGGKRVSAVRRGGNDDDARFSNVQAACPVVQRNADARPLAVYFLGNPLERLQGQRFVGFVLQIEDASAGVVVAHEPQERDHSAIDPPAVRFVA